ncbi:MAG: methyltransferase domain-containing protein [Rhodanobacteraceae bacterium]
MTSAPESLFDLPEILATLREELSVLPAHAARQPAGRALILQPGAAARAVPFDLRHLSPTRVHVDGELLRGDVVCSPRALPWEDESFQLVLAQHLGDALPTPAEALEEIARVMAPGSLLLWFGFNPWSPWLAWMHWRARGGLALPQTSNVDALRRRLARAQLASVGCEYFGTPWPRRSTHAAVDSAQGRLSALTMLRCSYLVTARKQRAVLTPLRPRVARSNVALGTRLAGTPSQRACA